MTVFTLQYSYEFNYIKGRRQAVYFNNLKNLCISPLMLHLPHPLLMGHKAVCLTVKGPGSTQGSSAGPRRARPPNAFRCTSVQNFRIWCSYSQPTWQQKPKSSFHFWRRQNYWRPHQPKPWGDVSPCLSSVMGPAVHVQIG